jgi:3-dehydroquinate dehydratase-2
LRKIFVLNGSNLNLLGIREPEIYGHTTLDDIRQLCENEARVLDLEIDFRQTNHEGVLVDWVHEAHEKADGIVMNAASYARTSLALLAAVKAVRPPVIEVHLINLFRREAGRPPTHLSRGAHGVICGFGPQSYTLGLRAIKDVLDKAKAS